MTMLFKIGLWLSAVCLIYMPESYKSEEKEVLPGSFQRVRQSPYIFAALALATASSIS